MPTIIKEKQNLTYLKWSHIRHSGGTAGTFLKSSSTLGKKKEYYKLSLFDSEKGIIGHECINEIIADRLLTILGIEHLSYTLINADIAIDGRIYSTYLCASEDFKKRGESKIALDDYYRTGANPGESKYDFCVRQGFKEYIDRMIAFDYIILNRDRHGANIEVLRNSRQHTLRIAPLFDHGSSLLCSCLTPETASAFDVMADKPCNNYIGTRSCLENLEIIKGQKNLFPNQLKETDKCFLLDGLDDILPAIFINKIWDMIYERYLFYENL
ncbi:hypothetical protein SAMN04487770_13038 [Butyrivibrio sp. ob235]|uniref:hypothetical protein n=1 Tax=Butyrivibrio sp. ob235 TaxID=1761780 RepID=UPI0008D22DDB|nr:hypothetical protein [Butyrivibrio sp. ob235]SEM24989.1 hypothetical protein SAMN04487770_13038 [Butyrivibrio sp. ob235]